MGGGGIGEGLVARGRDVVQMCIRDRAQGVEFFVERFDLRRRGILQRGAQVDVAGQDERQRAEFIQVVAQQGGVDLAGAASLQIGFLEGAVARPFACLLYTSRCV